MITAGRSYSFGVRSQERSTVARILPGQEVIVSWSPCPDPELGNRREVDAIDTVLVPRAVDLGGMDVRRALPSKERQMVGPFIFFDEMGPAKFLTNRGIDVKPHPHINLATLTYLFDGEIVHRDNLGTEQVIAPGAVNWMRAGRGIVHSERTSQERRRSEHSLFGLQTWVALPEDVEESEPVFKHHGAEELPLVEEEGLRARVVAGELFGASSPLQTASPTLHAELSMETGTRAMVRPEFTERAIYTLEGKMRIGDCAFPRHQLVILRPGASVEIEGLSQDAHCMIFGGEPMEGPRYIWWNFVSSRLDRIEQAKEEWARGEFETVPGDEEEFIPLPEGIGRPRRARRT